MLLRVLLNPDDEQFQHPLVGSLMDISLLLADHTGSVCRADALVEGIWIIFDDQQCVLADQDTALQTFRAPGGSFQASSADSLLPLVFPLPLLNGSVHLRARFLQTSQMHGGRVFRLRCQVSVPSQGNAPPLRITGHSQAFCTVRYKLEMLNVFPDVFYKDRGGDSQSLEINGRFTDVNGESVSPSELETLIIQLSVMYENKQRIDTNQKNILSVKTCTVDSATSTFFCNFRILEVSRHHRGQRFSVCVSPSHGDFAPLFTAAVEVKSKKLVTKKDRHTLNFHHTNIHSLTANFGDLTHTNPLSAAAAACGEGITQSRSKKRQRQPGLGGGDANAARALSILIMGYESLLDTIKRNEWEAVGDDGQYTTYKCKFCGVFCLSLSTPVHRPTCPIWAHMQTHDVAISAVIPLLRTLAVCGEDVLEESVGPHSVSPPSTSIPLPSSSSSTCAAAANTTQQQFCEFSPSCTFPPLNDSSSNNNNNNHFMHNAPGNFTPPQSSAQSKDFSHSSTSSFANTNESNFDNISHSFNTEIPDMDDLGGLFGTGFFSTGLTCAQERALEDNEDGFQFMEQFFSEPQMRSLGGKVSAAALAAAVRSAGRNTSDSFSANAALVSSTTAATTATTLSMNGTSLASSVNNMKPSSSAMQAPSSFPASHPLNPLHPSHSLPLATTNPANSVDVWRAMEKLKLASQKVQSALLSDCDTDSDDEEDEGEDESNDDDDVDREQSIRLASSRQ